VDYQEGIVIAFSEAGDLLAISRQENQFFKYGKRLKILNPCC
jgi:hypothetical protein